uniref:Uncharacterized protein n=1 Tax=Phaseolus vulgaris TaxID=3885 RepID=I7B2E6_PHAVU|nr:uncharacterized protein [Phaseolus vulgaris]
MAFRTGIPLYIEEGIEYRRRRRYRGIEGIDKLNREIQRKIVRIPRKWQKDTNKSLNILVYCCFTVTKECLQREQTPFHTGLLLSRITKSKSSPYPKPVDLKEILMHCRVEFNSFDHRIPRLVSTSYKKIWKS